MDESSAIRVDFSPKRWYNCGMDVQFSPLGSHLFIPIVIAAGLSALIIWGVLGNPRLSRGRKLTLLGLRLAVVVPLFWILLRPATVWTIQDKEAASVAVLVDSSRSMSFADCPSETRPERGIISRYAALGETIKQADAALKRLGKSVDLKSFAFDKNLYPISLTEFTAESGTSEADQPQGELTALGNSLEELLRREAGKRFLGVVVLSDGSQKIPYSLQNTEYQTAPQSAATQYQRLGIPLYTIVYGQSEEQKQGPDASIDDINAPPLVFLRNALTVQGQIRIDNLAGQAIPVRLYFETKPGALELVAETSVTAETGSETIPVDLSYAPKEVGEFKARLEIAPPTSDDKPQNNQFDTFVRVVDGGLNVLYLEGAIRPEQKFLSRAFGDSPNVRIDVVRLDSRKKANQQELKTLFENDQYDVFILGDVHSSLVSDENWEILVKRVELGAGLFLLGGFNAYGPGGYAESPLAQAIPIQMDRLERQNPNDVPAADLHIDQYVKVVPTAAGRRYPSLQIGSPEANGSAIAAIWSQIPALEGANKWQAVKPGAAILATASDSRQSPILVSSRFGKGLVLAFAGDSTWRWPLAGFSDEHKRFWLQSIFWLGQKKQTIQGALTFSANSRRVATETPVLFNAKAETSDGKPVAPSDLELVVKNPAGQSFPVALKSEKGKLTAVFEQTSQPGDYSFTVKAFKDGVLFGQTQGRFQAIVEDLELDQPSADPGLMRQIAAASGGRSLQPNELPGLFNDFLKQADQLEITRQVNRTLWDSSWLLWILVALWSVEWALRKRWGEV